MQTGSGGLSCAKNTDDGGERLGPDQRFDNDYCIDNATASPGGLRRRQAMERRRSEPKVPKVSSVIESDDMRPITKKAMRREDQEHKIKAQE